MSDGRLLIVDDDERARVLLGRFLEVEGYQVDTAKDGADGLTKFEEGSFDLIITDLRMPNMGGIELLKHIQAKGGDTILIFITF